MARFPAIESIFEAIQDVYARAERGERNIATSEAEPHARRSEARPRSVSKAIAVSFANASITAVVITAMVTSSIACRPSKEPPAAALAQTTSQLPTGTL